MIYGAIIAAWTALNKTILRWSRIFTIQKELILVAESNQVPRRHLVDVLRDQHYRTIEASTALTQYALVPVVANIFTY